MILGELRLCEDVIDDEVYGALYARISTATEPSEPLAEDIETASPMIDEESSSTRTIGSSICEA